MNPFILKKIDHIAGSFLARLCPRPACSGGIPVPVSRVLLIRPGGIGDAVLLVPAIRRLRELFPGATVHVLAEKRNAGALYLCPAVDRVLHYDRLRDLIAALSCRYDVVVDSEQWHHLSALVARLARASVKIGFGTNERRRFFTHAVSYSHGLYEADSFFKLLEPLGGHVGFLSDRSFLSVPEQADSAMDELLAPVAGGCFVSLFPGASIPERRWGVENFRALVERLESEGVLAVVVGGAEDREMGEHIVAGTSGLNLAGQTTLAETAAVIKRSRLLVSGDSGVLHIAVGLAVPTVSLFGPGIAAKWAPRGGQHIVINKGLDCSPCTRFGTTPPCPRDAQCIKEISVTEVLTAVMDLLSRSHHKDAS